MKKIAPLMFCLLASTMATFMWPFSGKTPAQITGNRIDYIAQNRNLSNVTIVPSDLPNGFIEIPVTNLAPLKQAMQQKFGTNVESFFMLINPSNYNVILGCSLTLSEQQKQRGWSFNQLDLGKEANVFLQSTLKSLVIPMSKLGKEDVKIEISASKEIPELRNTIGDSSVGTTGTASGMLPNSQKAAASVRMDLVIFHRNEVLTFASISYPNGSFPGVNVGELGRKLDKKIPLSF